MTTSQLSVVIKTENPDAVIVEDFVYQGDRRTKTKDGADMKTLIESIRMLCRALDVTCVIFENGEWKHTLVGARIANKNQVQHALHRALDLNTEVWDAYDKGGHVRDALGLGLAHLVEQHLWKPKLFDAATSIPRGFRLKID
jgi:Holliday junction resolvasome RuvABC endonuclease subunit